MLASDEINGLEESNLSIKSGGITEVIILQSVCGFTSFLRRLRFGNHSVFTEGDPEPDAFEVAQLVEAVSGVFRSIKRSSRRSPEVSPCHLMEPLSSK